MDRVSSNLTSIEQVINYLKLKISMKSLYDTVLIEEFTNDDDADFPIQNESDFETVKEHFMNLGYEVKSSVHDLNMMNASVSFFYKEADGSPNTKKYFIKIEWTELGG